MELSYDAILTWLFNLARGPFVWISFFVFVIGAVLQIYNFLSFTKKENEEMRSHHWPKRSIVREKEEGLFQHWLKKIMLSVLGRNPFLSVLSVVFHAILVLLPFCILGHNILLGESIHFSFFSLPEIISDYLTVMILCCVIIFLMRRIFLSRVRMITTCSDYVFLFLAAAPFITGYLAYHQTFQDSYRLVLTLHMLSGEVMLMTIPFTKFVHMLYFFLVRFSVISEWNIGQGRRYW